MIQRIRLQVQEAKTSQRLHRMEQMKIREEQAKIQHQRDLDLKEQARRQVLQKKRLDQLVLVKNMIETSRIRLIFYKTFLAWASLAKLQRTRERNFRVKIRIIQGTIVIIVFSVGWL